MVTLRMVTLRLNEEFIELFPVLEILKLVQMGRIGLAIEQTTRAYPGLLESNQNLMFMLKCRQFVEMVNGSDLDVSSISESYFSFQDLIVHILFTSGIELSDDFAVCSDIRHPVDEALPTVADGPKRAGLQQ